MDLSKQIRSVSDTIKIDPKFEKLPLKRLIVFSFFSDLILIVVGLLSRLILPPEIPLFFGLPQTEEMLAPSILLIFPPLIALFLVTINSIISIQIESAYIKKSLAFASFAVSLLCLIATIKIIFLVGSI